MNVIFPSAKRFRFAALLIAIGAVLCGCSSSAPSDDDPSLTKKAVQLGGFATTPPTNTPDFIKSTRSEAKAEFIPVGTSAEPRALKLKTAAEVEAAQNELSQTRTANEARGAQAKTLSSLPTVQAPTVPAPLTKPDLKLRP